MLKNIKNVDNLYRIDYPLTKILRMFNKKPLL